MKIITNSQEAAIYDIILEQKKRISEQETLIERLKEQVNNLEMTQDMTIRWNNTPGMNIRTVDDLNFPSTTKEC